MLVTLSDVKEYLRVDTADEDAVISTLLSSAERLCVDVARIPDEMWAEINADGTGSEVCTVETLTCVRAVMKVAILYAVAYMYEHREKADYTELTLTLRSLLFAVREGVMG